MENLVSVIIPVYKVEKFLKQCVQSVRNQTYSALEIILVDDGSPDACPEICDEFAKLDGRIKVIHQQNGGLSAARNAGTKICTGNYVMFVDSDDFLHPKAVEDLLQNLLAHNADISIGNQVDFRQDEQPAFTNKIDVYSGEKVFDCYLEHWLQSIRAWNKIYKAEIVKAHPFLTGKLCEDSFNMHLFMNDAKTIVYAENQYYFYRIANTTSISNGMMNKNSFDELESHLARLKFFKENNFENKYIMFTYQLIFAILINYWFYHNMESIKQKSKTLFEQLVQELKAENLYSKLNRNTKIKIFLFHHCKLLLKLLIKK